MTARIQNLTIIGLASLCLLLSAGCASSEMQVESGELTLPAGENSAEFLDRVSAQPTVSQNDAMRGVLFLLDGKDEAESFAQRVSELSARGITAGNWGFSGDKPITRGKLAYMVFQACNMPGGLTLALAGPSQRYCLRELQYQGFLTTGVLYSDVSGMEFVAVITRADAYIETGEVPRILSASQYR